MQQLNDAQQRLDDAFDAEDWHAVLRLASEVLALDSGQSRAHRMRASAYIGLKDRSGFVRAMEENEAAVGAGDDLAVFKAFGLALVGDFDGAIEIAEDLAARMPTVPDVWHALGLARLGKDEGERAMAAAERALGLDSKTSIRFLLVAEAASQIGDHERGLEATKAGLELAPSDVALLVYQTYFLLQFERLDEASATADRAYAIEPRSPEVLRWRAAVAGIRQEWGKARETITAWLAQNSSSPDALSHLALVEWSEEHWEQAIVVSRRALEAGADDLRTKLALAIALLEVGSYPEALAIYSDLAVASPEDEFVWLGKSAAERLTGQTGVAVDSALRALEAGKFESARGWVQLAIAYSAAARHGNAWRAFDVAKRLQGDLFEALVGVAVESIRCHREARALVELGEAEARIGAHGLIEFNRGVAHYRLGDQELARTAWESARKLDPELGATDILLVGVQRQKGLANWSDYWFGQGVGSWRRIGGGLLLMAFLVSLVIPFLRPDLIPGLMTGRLSLQAFLPSALVGLLIVWPAIRGLKVGSVSLEVAPIAPEERMKLDPSQVLPALEYEEIDIGRLVLRRA